MLILSIDEEPNTASYFETILPIGFDVFTVKCPETVIATLKKRDFDLVVLDIEFDHGRGMDLIPIIAELHGSIPVVVHSRSTNVQDIVACMKLGAYQYYTKLIKRKTFLDLLYKCESFHNAMESTRLVDFEDEISFVMSGCNETTDTERMLRFLEAGTVFLNGESGTGKLLLARHLHERYRMIERPDQVSSGSFFIYSGLNRSFETQWTDLFGAEAGMLGKEPEFLGVFEKLTNGTVYIEEIGNLAPGIQEALCQMLETGTTTRFNGSAQIPVHCQMIVGSVLGVSTLQREHSIIPRLMERLRHYRIELKPLRNRQKEVIALAWLYLRKATQEIPSISARKFHPAVLEHLVNHQWPGNITELRNSIFSAIRNCKGEEIRISDFIE